MNKRQERARARRRYERQQEALAQRAERRSKLTRIAAAGATVAISLGLIVGTVWWSGRDDTSAQASGAPSASQSSSSSVAGCEPAPRPLGTTAKLELPAASLSERKTWTAAITTNCGVVEMELDGARAPQAVASFIQLARTDYWKAAPCHRLGIGDGFKILQCGDPTGTGQGTPGYGFAVENAPSDGSYRRGTVAMARTNDPKSGNGGQFFIMYGDTALPDPAGYTVLGRVTKGLDIVAKIAAAGVQPGGESPTVGSPTVPLSILRVVVTQKESSR